MLGSDFQGLAYHKLVPNTSSSSQFKFLILLLTLLSYKPLSHSGVSWISFLLIILFFLLPFPSFFFLIYLFLFFPHSFLLSPCLSPFLFPFSHFLSLPSFSPSSSSLLSCSLFFPSFPPPFFFFNSIPSLYVLFFLLSSLSVLFSCPLSFYPFHIFSSPPFLFFLCFFSFLFLPLTLLL